MKHDWRCHLANATCHWRVDLTAPYRTKWLNQTSWWASCLFKSQSFWSGALIYELIEQEFDSLHVSTCICLKYVINSHYTVCHRDRTPLPPISGSIPRKCTPHCITSAQPLFIQQTAVGQGGRPLFLINQLRLQRFPPGSLFFFFKGLFVLKRLIFGQASGPDQNRKQTQQRNPANHH